LIRRQTNK